MNLYDAWIKTKISLTPQRQGDCGIFSFWYATVLLREIEPLGRSVVYPKKEHIRADGLDLVTADESIRHFAKATIKSGQGELLTAQEMSRVIERFGYKNEVVIVPGDLIRQRFITMALANNRPVLFPYTKGDAGPVDAVVAMGDPVTYGTPGKDFGSHWSLLIMEDGGNYTYIDPHHPDQLTTVSKQELLQSNANVDSQQYVRIWGKPALPQDGKLVSVGASTAVPSPVPLKKFYDIGQVGITNAPRVQNLANVLISVF